MQRRAADLRAGDLILGKGIPGHEHSKRITIVRVAPSKDLEGHTAIEFRSRNGGRKLARVKSDEMFTLRETSQRPQNSKSKCSCSNHMNTQKNKYPSREKAVEAIVQRHMKYGEHRVYECPTVPGIFHITSKKEKSSNSS